MGEMRTGRREFLKAGGAVAAAMMAPGMALGGYAEDDAAAAGESAHA